MERLEGKMERLGGQMERVWRDLERPAFFQKTERISRFCQNMGITGKNGEDGEDGETLIVTIKKSENDGKKNIYKK